MTNFENLLLRYIDSCVRTLYYGCQKDAAEAMGLPSSTLCTWLQYYNSNGAQGNCPQLRRIGIALDALGVPLETRADCMVDEPDSNLTSLEKMVFGFIVRYIDKHHLSFEDAGKVMGLKTPSLVLKWMDYYTSDGFAGVCPKIDVVGVALERIGVYVKRRCYSE